MSGDVEPRCAWCGAPVPFSGPDGKVPAWVPLCCGADACVAVREAEEVALDREYEQANAR